MKIDEVIEVLRNRIRTLNELRLTAVQRGDLEKIGALDAEIEDTQATIDKLQE